MANFTVPQLTIKKIGCPAIYFQSLKFNPSSSSLTSLTPSPLNRSITHMLSQPKHSTGDVRKSSGNMKYDDSPEQPGHQSLDYSGFDYMQSNNSSFDSQPPPAPPMHGYRDPGYMPSENLDSEPASDEEAVKSRSKKSFSNLFQKKKNNDNNKQRAQADRKGRSRAASRASQVSTDGDGSFTQPAYAYYSSSGEVNRAKQFGRSSDHPPPMLPQDSEYI
jgi:hypothetical protein